MAARRFLRRSFLHAVLFLSIFACLAPGARADVIDDLADLLIKVDDANIPIDWLPVSGHDIKNSKGMIACVGNAQNDVAALICIEDYKNTPVGQKINQQSGIPSWFWDLMDTYIAFRNGEVLKVVAKLGEAVLCIVVQVITGGVDVCGFIEGLIEIAEEMLDAAKAVAQFFKDLGEAVWDAVQDVGCALNLGGCDDDNTPLEVVAYHWIFAPKVSPEGLQAIEAVDGMAFSKLRQQLVTNALARPPKVSDPALEAFMKNSSFSNFSFPKDKVDIAAKIFDEAVEAQWSADIAVNVHSALAQKRKAYGSPALVATLAPPAIAAYAPSGTNIKNWVSQQCAGDFNQSQGFAHVDRWVWRFPQDAQKLQLKSNFTWCATDFWNSSEVRSEFAKHLRTHVADTICPQAGQGFRCQSLEKFDACRDLLGMVGYEGECGVDVGKVGKEVAEKIVAELKGNGSTWNYAIKEGSSFFVKPVDLVCGRPTQAHACNAIYEAKFGGLPSKVVNCRLEMSPDYLQKKQATAAEAARLTAQHQEPLSVDGIDPLIVIAQSSQILTIIQEDPQQQFPFKFYPLKVPRHVDGVNEPSMAYDMELPAPKGSFGRDRVKDKILGFRDGIDPMNENIRDSLTSPVDRVGGMDTQLARPEVLAPAVMGVQLQAATPGQVMATTPGQMATGMPAQAPTAPMQTMSGTLPGGAPGGAATPLAAPAPLAQSIPTVPQQPQQMQAAGQAALPDITAEPQVALGGRRLPWGQNVALAAAAAQRSAGGICYFPVQYGVRNAGAQASGPFYTTWSNSLLPQPVGREWPSLASGAVSSQSDTLGLTPGQNMLTLTIDQRGQVRESNEQNNQFRIAVTLSGECGPVGQRPPLPEPTPTQPAPMPVPTRTPLPLPVR